MEIVNIYWREDALSNLKDIIASYHRQGKRVVARLINEIGAELEVLRKRPHHGYYEASMRGQSQKIFAYFITKRRLKVLYYTIGDTLYIIDFWDA